MKIKENLDELICAGKISTRSSEADVFEIEASDFDKAIEQSPDFYFAYFKRALTKLGLKKTEEALADFEKTIELNDTFYLAYQHRGNKYF